MRKETRKKEGEDQVLISSNGKRRADSVVLYANAVLALRYGERSNKEWSILVDLLSWNCLELELLMQFSDDEMFSR